MTDTSRRDFVAAVLGAAGLAATQAGDTGVRTLRPVRQRARVELGRRIVTGVDAEGRSEVAWERTLPDNVVYRSGKFETMDFWLVREVPAPTDEESDPLGNWTMENRAPPGGIIGRMGTWAPGATYRMHSTPTVDLMIVIAGQIRLELETTSRVLGPGDVVVQRGTRHAWAVVGDEPCTFVGVMVDAKKQM